MLAGDNEMMPSKRELIVLITPKVIFNHQIATQVTLEYAEKMQLLKASIVIEE